jgi:uncharacterized membrane protein YgcG
MTVIGSTGSAPRAAAEPSGADDAKIDTVGKFVVGGLGLMFLLGSTTLGIVGLLFCGMATTGLFYFCYPDWRGWLFAGAYVLAWCTLRWLFIRRNVEKYHLKETRNRTLTWARCFVAAGLAGPEEKGERMARASGTVPAAADEGFSFSFAGSGDGGGSSGDSSSGSSSYSSSTADSGGASGGGAASGDW